MKFDKVNCPKCQKGILVQEMDEFSRPYFHCDNCDYQIHNALALKMNKRCPLCGDFLLIKKGRKGTFLACHSCDYKEVK